MNKSEYLRIVEGQINYIFDHKAIRKELENHLDDHIEDLINDGYSQDDAEKLAVKMMGDPIEIGKQLNEIHSPLLGYILLSTKLILASVICLVLLQTFPMLPDTIKMLSPLKVENYQQTIPLNIEINLGPSHLVIDNIHKNGNMYKLTYRSFKDYSYSRASWVSTEFWLKKCDGTNMDTSSAKHSALIGHWGYYEFYLENDTHFTIITRNNKTINIDLKEYAYE